MPVWSIFTSCLLTQSCFSAEELLLIHGVEPNSSSGLGRSDLARLSPAFVQQILSGACADVIQPVQPDGLSVIESKCWNQVTAESAPSFSHRLGETRRCRIHLRDDRQRRDNAGVHVWHRAAAVYVLHQHVPALRPVLH